MKPEDIKTIFKKDLNIDITLCQSSNIVGYGYDNTSSDLWVIFKNNKAYRYKDIDESLFKELDSAESKGKWVNANLVKNHKEYEVYGISQG